MKSKTIILLVITILMASCSQPPPPSPTATAAPTATIAPSATALPPTQGYDLVFADPPYAPGSGSTVAEAVAKAGWLAPGGWMAIETHKGDTVTPPEGWEIDAERDVGQARLTLLRA